MRIFQQHESKAGSFHSGGSSATGATGATGVTNTSGGFNRKSGVTVNGQPVTIQKYKQMRTVEYNSKDMKRIHVVR